MSNYRSGNYCHCGMPYNRDGLCPYCEHDLATHAAELAALRAQVEALKLERDRYQKEHEWDRQRLEGQANAIDRLQAELAESRRQVEMLREALQEFADPVQWFTAQAKAQEGSGIEGMHFPVHAWNDHRKPWEIAAVILDTIPVKEQPTYGESPILTAVEMTRALAVVKAAQEWAAYLNKYGTEPTESLMLVETILLDAVAGLEEKE